MQSKPKTSNLRVPYDSLTLCAVVSELRACLVGGQIQEVRQPDPTEIQMSVRNQGQTYWLLASVDARYARLHLVSARSPNPPTPPNFCMVLRRYLENGFVQSIRQRDFDRIVEIVVLSRDAEGEPTTVTLVGEFMGKHSNLILVRENGKIIDAIKRIPERLNRFREILPGAVYLSPPKQSNPYDPRNATHWEAFLQELETDPTDSIEGLAERLLKRFMGLSPFLTKEIATRTMCEGQDSVSSLRQNALEIFDATAREEFQPVLILPPSASPATYPFPSVLFPDEIQQVARSLNLALDFAYRDIVKESHFREEASTLRGQIQRAIQRLERQWETFQHLQENSKHAEKYQQIGELIISHLWNIQPGDSEVVVQDYFDPTYPERKISLDTTLSAQENAALWFEKSRTAREGADVVEEQKGRVLQPLGQLQEALLQLEGWEASEEEHNTAKLKALHKRLREQRLLPEETEQETHGRKAVNEFQGHKIRRIQTPQGYEMLMGETATANDFLLTRLASPNDLWFHVRASSSAHVVLRTGNRPDAVPRTAIEAAALLCARHSSDKHASIVPVDYTLRKYVRKPRGSAPGFAHYERETTLHVTP